MTADCISIHNRRADSKLKNTVYSGDACIYFSVENGNKPVVLPEDGKVVFICEAPGDRFIITTEFAENP